MRWDLVTRGFFMSLLSLLGIESAYGAPVAHQSAASSMVSTVLLMAALVAIFYFIIIRPQNKRRKDAADVVNNLAVGDEVVTIGGIVGRINKLKDNFIELTVSDNTHITMQKSSVANVLPKGSFDG